MARAMLSAGMVVLAARTSGEDVRAAIVESLAPFRTSAGSFQLENEWHYLLARA